MKNREQHKRLMMFRTSLGLNQTELAKKLGIPQNTWCQYEIGRKQPSLQSWFTMKRHARLNNIKLEDSLFEEEETTIKQTNDEVLANSMRMTQRLVLCLQQE